MTRVKSAFAYGTLTPAEVAVCEAKSRLMLELTDILDASGMTRAAAARRFGVPQPRVTDLKRGRIDNITVDMLIGMLACAGRHVRVSVRRRR